MRSQLCHDFNMGRFVIFIIDDSSKPGTHWVLLHRIGGGHLFLFDSFGAFGTNSVFRFNEFNDAEKTIMICHRMIINTVVVAQDVNLKTFHFFKKTK